MARALTAPRFIRNGGCPVCDRDVEQVETYDQSGLEMYQVFPCGDVMPHLPGNLRDDLSRHAVLVREWLETVES